MEILKLKMYNSALQTQYLQLVTFHHSILHFKLCTEMLSYQASTKYLERESKILRLNIPNFHFRHSYFFQISKTYVLIHSICAVVCLCKCTMRAFSTNLSTLRVVLSLPSVPLCRISVPMAASPLLRCIQGHELATATSCHVPKNCEKEVHNLPI